MGVKTLTTIVEQLVKAGRELTTPIALIQKGTTPSQKIVKGNISNIVELVKTHHIKPPSLIIIGDVVSTFEDAQLSNMGYLTPNS